MTSPLRAWCVFLGARGVCGHGHRDGVQSLSKGGGCWCVLSSGGSLQRKTGSHAHPNPLLPSEDGDLSKSQGTRERDIDDDEGKGPGMDV